ncbi:MAG: hypothetical protein AAGM22_27380 [Acidobacteriota bacterium]
MKITDSELESALDFLIAIEPDPGDVDSTEHYASMMERYQSQIVQAKSVIRQYGEEIRPRSLEAMQRTFYAIANSPKYRKTAIHASVARSALETGWVGINGWER